MKTTKLYCDEDTVSSQNRSLIGSFQHISVRVDMIQTHVSAKLQTAVTGLDQSLGADNQGHTVNVSSAGRCASANVQPASTLHALHYPSPTAVFPPCEPAIWIPRENFSGHISIQLFSLASLPRPYLCFCSNSAFSHVSQVCANLPQQPERFPRTIPTHSIPSIHSPEPQE